MSWNKYVETTMNVYSGLETVPSWRSQAMWMTRMLLSYTVFFLFSTLLLFTVMSKSTKATTEKELEESLSSISDVDFTIQRVSSIPESETLEEPLSLSAPEFGYDGAAEPEKTREQRRRRLRLRFRRKKANRSDGELIDEQRVRRPARKQTY